MFPGVEYDLEQWLSLAVTCCRGVQNSYHDIPEAAFMPFQAHGAGFIAEQLALAVLVLRGAVVRQQLVNFEQPVTRKN